MNGPVESKTCSSCGAPLTPGALQGLCPRCLLALNAGAQTEMNAAGPESQGASAAPAGELPALEDKRSRGRKRRMALIAAGAVVVLLGLGVWLMGLGLSTANGIVTPPGLVSWWAAEGNCRDEAGTNNGTLQNGATFAAGRVGQAFSFDGVNSYVRVPGSPSLDVGGQFTIDFWMKADPNNPMTSVQGLVTSDFYGISIGNPWYLPCGIFAYLSTDGGASFVHTVEGNGGGAVVSPGQWHHIAASYDGRELQLYVDGQPWGKPVSHPGAVSPMLGTSFVAIGSEDGRTGGGSNLQGRYFNGLIDEVDIFNRALSASEVQAIFAAGAEGKRKPGHWLSGLLRFSQRQLESMRSLHGTVKGPPPGLVGWWRGEGTAKDSAGANDGRLLGEATFAPGKVGQAFCFDPESGTVAVPDSPSLQLVNELTIEAWIKPRSLSGPVGYAIVSKLGIGTGNNGYQLLVVGDTLQGLFNSTGLSWPSQRIISGPLIRPGLWYHVAFTYDQSAMKLYCNGQLAATRLVGKHDIATSTTDLRISGTDNHACFDGLIDEASVYNRALSAAEVASIFSAGQNGESKSSLRLPANGRSRPHQPAPELKEWLPVAAPGRKPDPNKVRDEANALKAKGKHQAALDRYLWYWNHALEYEPALSAVRLSFLLSDWVELSRAYPKAKQALLDIRTQDTQRLLDRRGDFDVFMELSSLNQYLQDEDATYEGFKQLRHRDPGLAWQCFFVVEPLLVKHGDYALCLEYLGEPQAAFNRLRQQWDLLKGQEQRWGENSSREFHTAAGVPPPAPPQTADQRFVDETRQLILILVKTEHRTEAERIRNEALDLVDDPRLKSAVSDAEGVTPRR